MALRFRIGRHDLRGREPAPILSSGLEGAKTAWHGFDRYDFLMDEATLAIKEMQAADDEKDGIKHPVEGQRRCIVVVPRVAAPGNPWSWRGCYWDHQPQTEVELLRRGFHIAYVESSATLKPGRQWDAWYAFLTEKHGLSRKPAFIGMSRGGEYAYTWATSNPDKVSCVYADNPGGNPEMMMRIGATGAARRSLCWRFAAALTLCWADLRCPSRTSISSSAAGSR